MPVFRQVQIVMMIFNDMSDIEKLIKYFELFPGVGARQARRFSYHILTLSQAESNELGDLIKQIKSKMVECISCRRYFLCSKQNEYVCNICSDNNRDRKKLLVVATDNDLNAIEKSKVFNGLYYVLGGTLPLLSETESKRLRINGLKKVIKERCCENECIEIILGFPINPDGENTVRFVRSHINKAFLNNNKISITELGRGLSTGSEIEYADSQTIKNALYNRFKVPE